MMIVLTPTYTSACDHPTLLALLRQATPTTTPLPVTPPSWREEANALVQRHLMSIGIPHDCLCHCRYEIADCVDYASIVVSVTFHYYTFAPIALRIHLLGDGTKYHGTRTLTRMTNDGSQHAFAVALPKLARNTLGEWEVHWAFANHDNVSALNFANALRLAADHMEAWHEHMAEVAFRNSDECLDLGIQFLEYPSC